VLSTEAVASAQRVAAQLATQRSVREALRSEVEKLRGSAAVNAGTSGGAAGSSDINQPTTPSQQQAVHRKRKRSEPLGRNTTPP
jgi:hypothetical protein